MDKIEKIKLNLFSLKSQENLIAVHQFFFDFLEKFFDTNGKPIEEFFEYTKCPICQSEEREHSFDVDKFSYYSCGNCDSIYTYPFLKSEIIADIYSSGAYDEYQKKLVHSSQGLRKDLLDKRKVDQIEFFLPERGNLFDIGCGQGTFLKSCKDRGWKVAGLDPSDNSARLAKEKFDIDVTVSTVEEFTTTESYDCVTFWGVLEHLLEPQKALDKVSKFVRKGGIVQFEVPSSDCLIAKHLKKKQESPTRFIESGRHNILFSRKAIDQMAANTGFEVAYIESNGLDLQTLLLEEFSEELTQKILTIQDVLNDELLGDHYRVFLRKL